MNKNIFTIAIIVFFLKTGNVLSNSKIFNVDNIIINNITNQEISQIVNKAFKEGFKKLIRKILLKNDLEKVSSTNLDDISKNIRNLTDKTPAKKIFAAINSYSLESEIRYVGGCIRKIINKENISDIDLATNLEPKQVCEALKNNNIMFYESGIQHGTITALENKYKFEITSLRKDVFTDGRHAKVEFTKDWKEDAGRRDFTINSVYADQDGNLFDPFNGKKDLEKGIINFIGC